MEPMERQLIHNWIESLLEQSDQQALVHYRPKKTAQKMGRLSRNNKPRN